MCDEMIDKGLLAMEKYIPFAFRAGVALGARQAVMRVQQSGKARLLSRDLKGKTAG